MSHAGISDQVARIEGVQETVFISNLHQMTAIQMNCICLNSQFILSGTSEQVLQCANPACRRMEHLCCVFPNNILSWSIEEHHCMKCRMAFADPFWHSASGRPEIIPPTSIQHIRTPRKAIPVSLYTQTSKLNGLLSEQQMVRSSVPLSSCSISVQQT